MLKKFILTVALICTICVGVIAASALRSPAIVGAADDSAHTHPVCGASHTDIGNHTGECANVTFTAWDGTTVIPYDSNKTAYVYLSKNVELEQLDIQAGYTLYLCLNGFSISSKWNGTNFNDTTIYVNDNAKLALCDCKGSGKITHNTGLLGNGVYVGGNSYGNGGTFIMYGGEISGNTTGTSSAKIDGAGVTVQNGTFYMYNGKISDNHCTNASNYGGGGVLLSGEKFYMYGGEISGNSSSLDGGGIFAIGCDLKIYGGKISGNNAGADGGGLCVYNTTPDISNDVEISGNSALRGGGIYAAKQSFTISGNVKISNNTASVNGGGIYSYSQDLYILDNVEISGNTAADNGGGIYFKGEEGYTTTIYTLTISNLVKIIGNTASVNGGGIDVESGSGNTYELGIGNLVINGGSVTNNTVTADNGYGGGVYFNGGTFNTSGDVTVYGNTKNSKANNSYLMSGSYITINGKLTGNGKIGVMTQASPSTDNYVKIAKISSGNKDSFSSDKFVYENTSKAELSTAISYKTLYLVACVHEYGTEYAYDENSHWHGCSLCDKKKDEAAHTVVTDEAKAATCTETGLTEGKHCSVCNTVLVKQETVKANGHDLVHHEAKAATCTEIGWEAYDTCSRCDYTTYKKLDKLGHDWAVKWSSDDTNHWHDCSRCDEKKDKAAHSGGTATCTEQAECEVCGQPHGNANGHDLVHHEAKAATCTAIGWEAYDTCSRCDYTTYKKLDKLGHDWAVKWSSDDTNHWHDCSRCDEKKDKAAHSGGTATCTEQAECEVCGQPHGNANGHDLVHHEAKAATCTAIGWEAYDTCNNCDYTTYKELKANGHDWKTTWSSDDTNHWHDCKNCDVKSDLTAHSGGTATCTEQAECEVCGQPYGNANGHDLVHHEAKAATCTEDGWEAYDTCSRCDYTTYKKLDKLDHDLVHHEAKAATCTEDGWEAYDTCSRCDYTTYKKLNKLNHDWDDGEITTKPGCETEGVRTFKCKREGCGATKTEAVDKLGHNRDTEWTIDELATCTAKGSKSHHCSRCDDKADVTEIPANGHTEVVDAKVEPTCTDPGKTEGKHCSVCNEVLVAQQTIDANGHTEVVDAKVEPTCTTPGKTEGKHCSVCNEVLVAQTAVPATGHVYDDDYDATCNVCGYERADVKVATKILEGHDGKWNTGDSGELAFTTNVTSSKSITITVDGVSIDESKFERQNDGTKIVLKQEFLKTLSVGKHTISVISEDGTAATHFTVEARTATETKVGKAWWLLIIPLVAMLVVIGTIVIKNKKQDRKEK